MSAIISIMDKFWKIVKISDDKLHATQTEPEGIKRIYDVPYIDDGNVYHLLDVYYPEGTTGKLPVIIDVHGGGWMYGDKELNRIYCLNLAKRGFVVFNMSYRLIPEVSVNEQLQDIAEALKFINLHLDGYPCDKDNIMLTGDSAGGMLAVYSAVLLSSEKLRDIFKVVDGGVKLSMLTLTSPVAYMNEKGAMGIYTKIMWGKNYKEKSTYPYMNLNEILDLGTLPPTALITSSGDFLALKQTRRAADELKGRNIPAKLIDFAKFEGKNLPHVFSVLEPESKAGELAINNFIAMFRDIIADKTDEAAIG